MFDSGFHYNLQEIGPLINSIRGLSYLGIFLLAASVSYTIPIPETVVLILLGYAAGTGKMDIANVLIASVAGGIFGDNIVYRLSLLGHKYVEHFNQKVRSHKIIQYEHLVKNNIGKAIYFLRFIVGVRFFGPVISGTLGIRWKRFLPYNAGATLLRSSFFITLGYFFHQKIAAVIVGAEAASSLLLFSSVFIIGIMARIFSEKNKPQE